uniref:deoxyribonuclease gamma-like n=1 Tax=Myxine glutinosa TaxID=7769 RepID=UPI00358E6D9E
MTQGSTAQQLPCDHNEKFNGYEEQSDLGEMTYIASTKARRMKHYENFDKRRFFIRFQAHNSGISDCILVPVLTTTNVKKEVDELFDMFDSVEKHWCNKNVMFLGDFSTIAKYLDTQKQSMNNYDKFQWLIDGEMDTMVETDINYANDRFVAFGTEVQNAVVPGSAKPFNFLINYSLSQEEGLCIMDHYPIELDLEPPPHGHSIGGGYANKIGGGSPKQSGGYHETNV